LHACAKNGHYEICKLIIENTKDRNPIDSHGWTPFDLAASFDHFEISQVIIENLEKKDLDDIKTSFFCAVKEGQIDICNLIVRNIGDKLFFKTY